MEESDLEHSAAVIVRLDRAAGWQGLHSDPGKAAAKRRNDEGSTALASLRGNWRRAAVKKLAERIFA
jgi:hypothetical protein